MISTLETYGGCVKEAAGIYLAGSTSTSLAEQIARLAEAHSRVRQALELVGTRVEWQEIALYASHSCRMKQILVGIPSDAFWRSWRRLRADYKAAGVSLRKSEAGWEVVLWIPGSLGRNPF